MNIVVALYDQIAAQRVPPGSFFYRFAVPGEL
jgi:hypothetical protein